MEFSGIDSDIITDEFHDSFVYVGPTTDVLESILKYRRMITAVAMIILKMFLQEIAERNGFMTNWGAPTSTEMVLTTKCLMILRASPSQR